MIPQQKSVLQTELKATFDQVTVEVVPCPDLTAAPFHLTAPGLNGNPRILEIGGPPYLLPTVDRQRVYDLNAICRRAYQLDNPNGEYMAIGAGAGPWPHAKTNCEGVYNMRGGGDNSVTNGGRLVRIDNAEEQPIVERVPDTETRLPLLGNIYLSEGRPGPVLRVHCKRRIGEENFISSIRVALEKRFKNKTVALGGVFLLRAGTVKQHVMRDFSKTPIHTEEELNRWLKFFEMPGELINVGTLVSNDDLDLDVRLQHFHNFSASCNHGGHYHYDVTPETVEYEGYFRVGERLIRIDKPQNTHQVGRD